MLALPGADEVDPGRGPAAKRSYRAANLA